MLQSVLFIKLNIFEFIIEFDIYNIMLYNIMLVKCYVTSKTAIYTFLCAI